MKIAVAVVTHNRPQLFETADSFLAARAAGTMVPPFIVNPL
ncbi:hypothetical protein KMZ15_09025 [Mycoavidus sp. HKI]|nr:hypothetical protein [Mycoavidus sp. HKI]UTU47252.1 hypothetical protein KMZ15_09025 [Mycoavidus sp. HKI]